MAIVVLTQVLLSSVVAGGWGGREEKCTVGKVRRNKHTTALW